MNTIRESLNILTAAPTPFTYSEREAWNILVGAPALYTYSDREAANIFAGTTGKTVREALNARIGAAGITFSEREALQLLVDGLPHYYSPRLELYDDYGVETDAAVEFVAADKSWLSSPNHVFGDADVTFAVWVYITDASSPRTIFFTTGVPLNIYQQDTTSTFRTRSSGGTQKFLTKAVQLNQWHLLVVGFDATNDLMFYSLDGAGVTTETQSDLATDNAPMRIGNSLSDEFMQGAIDNAGLWGRVLTSAEITYLYNSGAGRVYADLDASMKTNLVSWWGFNEASGTRYDSHGTNHLTEQFANIIDATTLNGGFETAGGGGADVFGSWDESDIAGSSLIVDLPGRTGGHAAGLRIGTGYADIYQGSLLSTGKAYNISLWAKTSSANPSLSAVVLVGSSGNYVFGSSLTTSWQNFSTTKVCAGNENFNFVATGYTCDVSIDDVVLAAAEIKSTSGIARGAALSGETVSRWLDQSGNGNHVTQSTFSKRPTWVASGVTFDGVDDWLSNTMALTQPNWLLLVVTHSGLVGVQALFDAITNQQIFRTNGTTYEQTAGTLLSGGTATLATRIYFVKFSGASSEMRRDGIQILSGDAGATNLTGGLILGAAKGTATSFFNGKIRGAFAGNGTLSEAQVTAFTNWLKRKYSVS